MPPGCSGYAEARHANGRRQREHAIFRVVIFARSPRLAMVMCMRLALYLQQASSNMW